MNPIAQQVTGSMVHGTGVLPAQPSAIARPDAGPGTGAQARRFFTPAASLMQRWDELAARTGAAPYMHPGWVEAWWHAFGEGEPELRTSWHDGRLTAVLPMLRLGGSLHSTANYHTPGFMAVSEDAQSAAALIDTLFTDHPAHVSLCAVDPMDASMQHFERVARAAGYRVVFRSFQRSPYIDLKGGWEGYETTLSRNLLRNLRRARRHLEQQGTVTTERVRSEAGLAESLADALTVEASGWKGAGHTAILSQPRTRGFYTEVARWAARTGMLHLYLLRLDGRPLAMYYALEHRGVCHLLKGGYDPAYRQFSPGKLLMREVIRGCFAEGFSRIEFNGDAEAYKFSWASAVHERKRLDAFAPSLAGRLAWLKCIYAIPLAHRVLHGFSLLTRRKA